MQHSFQDLERWMADRTCKIENLVIPPLPILQVCMPHQVADGDLNIQLQVRQTNLVVYGNYNIPVFPILQVIKVSPGSGWRWPPHRSPPPPWTVPPAWPESSSPSTAMPGPSSAALSIYLPCCWLNPDRKFYASYDIVLQFTNSKQCPSDINFVY